MELGKISSEEYRRRAKQPSISFQDRIRRPFKGAGAQSGGCLVSRSLGKYAQAKTPLLGPFVARQISVAAASGIAHHRMIHPAAAGKLPNVTSRL